MANTTNRSRRSLKLTLVSWRTIRMHARNGRTATIASLRKDGSKPFWVSRRMAGSVLSGSFIIHHVRIVQDGPARARGGRFHDAGYHAPRRRARPERAFRGVFVDRPRNGSRHRAFVPGFSREGSMLKAGLVAFALALVTYFVVEPSLGSLLTSIAELFGVVGLFSLICLSELLD